jgi:hypothetical protein
MQRVFPSTLVLTDRDGKGKYLRSFLISSRMSTCTIYLALSSIYSHFCWSAHQVRFFLFFFLAISPQHFSGFGHWALISLLRPKRMQFIQDTISPWRANCSKTSLVHHMTFSVRISEIDTPFNDTMHDMLNTFFPYSTFSPFLGHKLGIHTFETKAKPTSVTYILSFI